MNNTARPITNQNISLKGIKATIITAMNIINIYNKKSSFIGDTLAHIVKELNRRN